MEEKHRNPFSCNFSTYFYKRKLESSFIFILRDLASPGQVAQWEKAFSLKVADSIPGQGAYRRQPENECINEWNTHIDVFLSVKVT